MGGNDGSSCLESCRLSANSGALQQVSFKMKAPGAFISLPYLIYRQGLWLYSCLKVLLCHLISADGKTSEA